MLLHPDLMELYRRASADNADDPAHDANHLLRVAAWTSRLLGDSGSERSAYAAALLHDLVNLPKDHPQRKQASRLSAERARDWLAPSFSPLEIDIIAMAIEDHSYSAGAVPRSQLGKALQDADRLDALGAVGIFRLVATGTRMGGRFFDGTDPWCRARTLDDRAYMVDHFFTKLLRLPASMQTEAGRAEAERRAAFMRSFLAELGTELDVPFDGQGR